MVEVAIGWEHIPQGFIPSAMKEGREIEKSREVAGGYSWKA